jgi:hypothetical protein
MEPSVTSPAGRVGGRFCREFASSGAMPPVPESIDTEEGYAGAHMLITHLEPRFVPLGGPRSHMPSHHSTANDDFVRLEPGPDGQPDGQPVLLPAWRYLLTLPEPDAVADSDNESDPQ